MSYANGVPYQNDLDHGEFHRCEATRAVDGAVRPWVWLPLAIDPSSIPAFKYDERRDGACFVCAWMDSAERAEATPETPATPAASLKDQLRKFARFAMPATPATKELASRSADFSNHTIEDSRAPAASTPRVQAPDGLDGRSSKAEPITIATKTRKKSNVPPAGQGSLF